MATYNAELYNAESVMDFYNESNGSKFKVYAGTSCKPEFCRWSYDGAEKTAGADILQQALFALKQNTENTNTYTLQVIQRAKKGKEEPEQTQISFRLNSPGPFIPYNQLAGVSGGDPEMRQMMKQMVENQNLLITKLSEREVETEEEKPTGIGALLENEQFQQVAIAGLSSLFSSFISRGQQGLSQQQPVALAGIPDDQQAKALRAIEVLSKRDPQYGDHLIYLAGVSDHQYKMLLSFMS